MTFACGTMAPFLDMPFFIMKYTKYIAALSTFAACTTGALAGEPDEETAKFVSRLSRVYTENYGKTICASPEAKIKELLPALQSYLRQHPDRGSLDDSDMLQALSASFPCTAPAPTDTARPKVDIKSIINISPIFSQIVMFSLPKGFAIVFEETKGIKYIREAIPSGENLQKWSQMITITGTQGLASSPNFTPQVFAANMAGGFKNACPNTFTGVGLGTFKVESYDAFAAFAGCGKLNATSDSFSESAIIFVIKGENDYYTLQWAERGPALEAPPAYDANKWDVRAKQLLPIKLCAIVPGESAPYPSCSGFKP